MKDYMTQLQTAIRRLHGCESRHISTVPVTEKFKGEVIWGGEVETFELLGHPTAQQCYAWAYQDDHGEYHFTAVLGLPPVDSALAAVRAALRAQADG